MGHADVLLLTVNEIETSQLADVLRVRGYRPRPHFGTINTYNVYSGVGGVNLVHLRTNLGSGGQGGSRLAVSDAIADLRPSAIIGTGVAFGADAEKQRIGDVLVSQTLTSYESQRVGTKADGQQWIIHRGSRSECSQRLLGRFRDSDAARSLTIRVGELLSGEKLIDYRQFKEELLAYFPEAIGGEMEGAGVLDASARYGSEWLVVKAICDFAESKDTNKTQRQRRAAGIAAEFVVSVVEGGGLDSR
jgi:nucleoside phosphorylase